jgi:hypothetical protein
MGGAVRRPPRHLDAMAELAANFLLSLAIEGL